MTYADLDRLFEGSKDDRHIVVGSEVRQLIGEIRRTRAERDRLRKALELVYHCTGPDGLCGSCRDRARAALAPDTATLGECVGHLGPPSNTATPHPKGPTCSYWRALTTDAAKEGT